MLMCASAISETSFIDLQCMEWYIEGQYRTFLEIHLDIDITSDQYIFDLLRWILR